eukprot:2694933-Amphidinium_carterae.2
MEAVQRKHTHTLTTRADTQTHRHTDTQTHGHTGLEETKLQQLPIESKMSFKNILTISTRSKAKSEQYHVSSTKGMRCCGGCGEGKAERYRRTRGDRGEPVLSRSQVLPVSYTHLTLPTILLV